MLSAQRNGPDNSSSGSVISHGNGSCFTGIKQADDNIAISDNAAAFSRTDIIFPFERTVAGIDSDEALQ